MSLRHLVLAGALSLSSCATSPEAHPVSKETRKNADTVAALVDSAGRDLGLSPIERALASRAAKKLAENPDKVEKLIDKAEKKIKNDPDLMDKLKKKADKALKGNPELRAKLAKYL